MKKLNTEEFIKRAKKVHGEVYDYSVTDYVNSETKIKYICPIHGENEQYPLNHLKGYGCRFCGHKETVKKQTLSNEEFIRKSREMHGNKYDYSKVEYVNNRTKVCIICPEHGEFWQRPSKHLIGQGCPECNVGSKLSQEDFLERAYKKYNGRYDYSKIKYIDRYTNITIICPVHGEFTKKPYIFLQGRGCPECGHERRRNAQRMTQEEFIQKAQKIHGDKYCYDNVSYLNSKTKVLIKCNKCGKYFPQEPRHHLSGVGCPFCKFSKLEIEIDNWLQEKGVKYIPQKEIENQFIDFYLPEYQVAIECHGKQHFSGKDFFGTNVEHREEMYVKNVQRDIRKFKKCQEQGIKVLYFTKDAWIKNEIYSEPIFEGIYNEDNVFTNKEGLLKSITK